MVDAATGFNPNTRCRESPDVFYGDTRRWSAILDANRHQLDSPEQIRPGWY